MRKSELFEFTRNYLEHHGWVQHTFSDEAGSCCLIEAMTRVSPLTAWKAAEFFVDKVLGHKEDTVFKTVVCFNDYPSTKQEDVFAALDKARELALKEGD